ncbi:MAG: hypothetical protein ACN6PV_27140, partial [Achromobacter sp.]|uniref:hypothetical protein n=1 Tax=Achromobacter sp. TaxID=134375 RepID=UPI003D02560E
TSVIGHVQRGLHLDHDFSCSNLTGNTVFPGFSPRGTLQFLPVLVPSGLPPCFCVVDLELSLYLCNGLATQRPWVEILRVFPQHDEFRKLAFSAKPSLTQSTIWES